MTDGERKLLRGFLLENDDATDLCANVYFVAHFFDDLIDRDVALDDATILKALWATMVDIPRNRFYREHFDLINPVVMTAIHSWMTATGWEKAGGMCLDRAATAFVIRSDYLNVLLMCATIVGGPHYSASMASWLREQFHSEGVSKYYRRLKGVDHV